MMRNFCWSHSRNILKVCSLTAVVSGLQYPLTPLFVCLCCSLGGFCGDEERGGHHGSALNYSPNQLPIFYIIHERKTMAMAMEQWETKIPPFGYNGNWIFSCCPSVCIVWRSCLFPCPSIMADCLWAGWHRDRRSALVCKQPLNPKQLVLLHCIDFSEWWYKAAWPRVLKRPWVLKRGKDGKLFAMKSREMEGFWEQAHQKRSTKWDPITPTPTTTSAADLQGDLFTVFQLSLNKPKLLWHSYVF